MAPPSAIDTLTNLTLTLHALNHRNKNQHRLAKWYKSLSQFLSQARKLLVEIEGWEAARAIKGKSKFTKKARDALRARVLFLRDGLLGKWYLAFSTVVADTQYSALGVMLVGSLARFQSALREVGKEVGVDVDAGSQKVEDVAASKVMLVEEERSTGNDLGEVVSRDKFKDGNGGETPVRGGVKESIGGDGDQAVEVEVRKSFKKQKEKRKDVQTDVTKEETTTVKRPKKKRKKGDAFDDLFVGLI